MLAVLVVLAVLAILQYSRPKWSQQDLLPEFGVQLVGGAAACSHLLTTYLVLLVTGHAVINSASAATDPSKHGASAAHTPAFLASISVYRDTSHYSGSPALLLSSQHRPPKLMVHLAQLCT